MFVSADRVLAIAIGDARPRLARLVRDGSLSETSYSAYQGGLDQLRVGPLGELPGASRLVRVRMLNPVYRDDTMTVGLRWEAIGITGRLFPVLDADISLSPQAGGFTRLAVTGCYRPPLGALGAGLDRVLLSRVAEFTVRSFLNRMARCLEGSLAAGPAPDVCRPAGPRLAPG
jgi:hypothetical protein